MAGEITDVQEQFNSNPRRNRSILDLFKLRNQAAVSDAAPEQTTTATGFFSVPDETITTNVTSGAADSALFASESMPVDATTPEQAAQINALESLSNRIQGVRTFYDGIKQGMRAGLPFSDAYQAAVQDTREKLVALQSGQAQDINTSIQAPAPKDQNVAQAVKTAGEYVTTSLTTNPERVASSAFYDITENERGALHSAFLSHDGLTKLETVYNKMHTELAQERARLLDGMGIDLAQERIQFATIQNAAQKNLDLLTLQKTRFEQQIGAYLAILGGDDAISSFKGQNLSHAPLIEQLQREIPSTLSNEARAPYLNQVIDALQKEKIAPLNTQFESETQKLAAAQTHLDTINERVSDATATIDSRIGALEQRKAELIPYSENNPSSLSDMHKLVGHLQRQINSLPVAQQDNATKRLNELALSEGSGDSPAALLAAARSDKDLQKISGVALAGLLGEHAGDKNRVLRISTNDRGETIGSIEVFTTEKVQRPDVTIGSQVLSTHDGFDSKSETISFPINGPVDLAGVAGTVRVVYEEGKQPPAKMGVINSEGTTLNLTANRNIDVRQYVTLLSNDPQNERNIAKAGKIFDDAQEHHMLAEARQEAKRALVKERHVARVAGTLDELNKLKASNANKAPEIAALVAGFKAPSGISGGQHIPMDSSYGTYAAPADNSGQARDGTTVRMN